MSGYGQHHQSMYSGSMVGAGAPAFAVMGYIIANTNSRSCCVELNPKLLAFVIGEPEAVIVSAIEKLCQPDPQSRSKAEDGKRLIRRGEFLYLVVNFAHYRDLLRKEKRKEYMADLMAKKRERELLTGANTMLTGANSPVDVDASVDASVPEGVQGEVGRDADDLPVPDSKDVTAIVSLARERFGLPAMDATINQIRANASELIGRGYAREQVETCLRWATSDDARHLRGRPQSAVSATDPQRISQWLQTMKTHEAELEQERKRKR